MICKPIYRFIATADGVDTEVYAQYDDELALAVERQESRNHYKESLSGSLTFYRESYDYIAALSIETRVLLTIYVTYARTDEEQVFFKGRFSKTDCRFDGDNRTVTVQLESAQPTQQVLDGLNREYNLVDIAATGPAVSYTIQPILQMYISGANHINNYVNGTSYETPVVSPAGTGSPYSETEIVDDYKFQPATIGTLMIVPFFEGMSPDVSGTYTFNVLSGNGFTRTDDAYDAFRIGGRWVIRDRSTGDYIYETGPVPLGTNVFAEDNFEQGVPFVPAAGGPNIYIYRVKVYTRLISPVKTLNGVTGQELPAEDIIPTSERYKFVIPLDDVPSIILSSENQQQPTRYGKYRQDAVGIGGRYFTEPTGVDTGSSGFDRLYPVSPSEWTYFSVWFYYFEDIAGSVGNGQLVTINDAYELHDVIAALLSQFAPNVTFQNDAAHSQFFYGVSGLYPSKHPVMIPKSNVILGEYDRAATRAEIRMQDVLELLLNFHNCDWYVDSAGRLRIEHVSWFENGGTYVGTNVGADLTQIINPRSGHAWTFRTNQWEYLKQEIPKRLEFSYMDKSSRAFEGYPIEVRSTFAQEDNTQQRPLSKFTTDLDYINNNPSEINPDGFVFLECEQSGSSYVVPFADIETLNGESYRLQNGFASFLYAHERYFRDAMPALLLTINQANVTANSAMKSKRQEIEYPNDGPVDPVALVKTGIGDGKPQRIEINFATNNVTITLRHDTE